MFLFVDFDFSKIAIFFLFSFSLSFLIINLSSLFNIYKSDAEKISPYECGFEPYEDARNIFDVRFYLVAILFIVFDLEVIYFLPWCAAFSVLNVEGVFCMIDFTFELLVGYIYAWLVGALEWD